MNFLTRFIFLVLISLLFSGCVSSNSTTVSMQTKTQPPSQTLSPATSIKTLTPTQTLTLTPPVTLKADEAKEKMKSLLQESMDCNAPCFWGITPDQTTLGEAKNIFTRFGLSLEYVNRRSDFQFYSMRHDFDTGLSIGSDLTIQNGIVKTLVVHIHPEDKKTRIPKEWSAYAPETLINRYGNPSKVTFDVDRGPSPGYGIALFFDAVDLIVYYGSSDLGPGLQICPLLDRVDHIRIWMGKNPHYPPSNDRIPLDEATSMTIEEFSTLMTNKPEKACFTLNINAFP